MEGKISLGEKTKIGEEKSKKRAKKFRAIKMNSMKLKNIQRS